MRRCAMLCVGVVLLMSGCGTGDHEKKGTVVYNCPANTVEIAILQKEIPQFAETSGVTIVLHPFTGQEKLYAMMAAGKAPDIFYTSGTMRDQLAAEGRLLDLRDVSKGDPFVDRLWPHCIRTGTSPDGGWYSVGNWEFTCGVYYRKDLFDAAGLPYPDTAWTWNEMVAAARALTVRPNPAEPPSRYGIFIGSHFVEALEIMNGSRFPVDGLTVTMPETSLEVYRKYLALMDEELMPDVRRVQAMGMQAPQLLQTGRVAMLVEAVPHQTLIETFTAPWGVAPLPRFDETPPAYFRSASGGLSVSSSTADPRAAWKALVWIISGASIYQPNPVMRDVEFARGWEQRYPALAGSGFRDVWDLSLKHNGGDPRFFVRYSSWTSGSILERLQPALDRLWSRQISVGELRTTVNDINGGVREELEKTLQQRTILPGFRRHLEQALKDLDEPSAH
jgi:ABC-type glycerol-3-phosphate transport system substrate-binding protein